MVKPNIGGSGAGIVRFDSAEELESVAATDGHRARRRSHGLVQEFIPARGGYITRVETLGGKFLYAIKVFTSGDTFNLCPADICQTQRRRRTRAPPARSTPRRPACKVEGYRPAARR